MAESCTMGGGCVMFQQADLANSAFPVFEEIRKQGKLCDVTIKVDDKLFSAHRIVLCATIPYFNSMFTISKNFSSFIKSFNLYMLFSFEKSNF